MHQSKKTFNGSGMVIWYADGKMKYKAVHDQETLEKELELLKARHPPRNIMVLAINWDEQEVLTFIGENEEKLVS